jgi:hypothetical protein
MQFLYFKPGQLATPAVHKDLQLKVDTIGPAPPSGLRTLPGNGRIEVTWTSISGDSGVSLLTGVKVYCDTAATPVTPAPTDASVDTCREEPIVILDDSGDADPDAGDAGTTLVCDDAGSSTPSNTNTCTSPAFVLSDGGKVLPDAAFNAQYECGSISGNTGTTVKAETVRGAPLTNFTTYAVAVAATDAFNNVGPLSEPFCEMPEPTTDFWDQYRAAGGQAGGGFCALNAVGMPAGSGAVLGIVSFAVVSLLLRKRKGR